MNQVLKDKNFYVVIKDNGSVIGNSQVSSFTASDVITADTIDLFTANGKVTFTAKINDKGGLDSTDGNIALSRSETMNIVGSQENYNAMLKDQGLAMPKVASNLDGTMVQINGKEANPEFLIYENGEIYVKGAVNPVSEGLMQKYWPKTYEKINGYFKNENNAQEESNDINPKGYGPRRNPNSSNGGRTDKIVAGGNVSSNGSKVHKTDGSKPANNSEKANNLSEKAGGAGDTVIKVDYSALEALASSISNLGATMHDNAISYVEAIGGLINNDNAWSGDVKNKLIGMATNQYKNYFDGVSNATKKLGSNVETVINNFSAAERTISGYQL